MLLIKDQEPDNEESSAGFDSYRFNVTLQPENGDYATGERLLNVYETSTGELCDEEGRGREVLIGSRIL